jgi:hypothetical protein
MPGSTRDRDRDAPPNRQPWSAAVYVYRQSDGRPSHGCLLIGDTRSAGPWTKNVERLVRGCHQMGQANSCTRRIYVLQQDRMIEAWWCSESSFFLFFCTTCLIDSAFLLDPWPNSSDRALHQLCNWLPIHLTICPEQIRLRFWWGASVSLGG